MALPAEAVEATVTAGYRSDHAAAAAQRGDGGPHVVEEGFEDAVGVGRGAAGTGGGAMGAGGGTANLR